MTKILFVCHGNICRSPMAEFIMKDIVSKANLSKKYEIASAATSTEEIGNAVYPAARRKLAAKGISCQGKTARQMTKYDYSYYDYIVAMDDDPDNKVTKLLEHTSRGGGSVADPWYTGNFDITWDDIYDGCMGLLKEIEGEA